MRLNQKKSDTLHILYNESSRTALEELGGLDYDQIDGRLTFRAGRKSYDPERLWEIGLADDPYLELAGASDLAEDLVEKYYDCVEELERERMVEPATHLAGVWALEFMDKARTAKAALEERGYGARELGVGRQRVEVYERSMQDLGIVEKSSSRPVTREYTETGKTLQEFVQEIEDELVSANPLPRKVV